MTVVLKQQPSTTTTQQNTKSASDISHDRCNAWTATFSRLLQCKINNLYLINKHDSRNYAHIWSEIDEKRLKVPELFSKIVFTHPPFFGFRSETFSTGTPIYYTKISRFCSIAADSLGFSDSTQTQQGMIHKNLHNVSAL